MRKARGVGGRCFAEGFCTEGLEPDTSKYAAVAAFGSSVNARTEAMPNPMHTEGGRIRKMLLYAVRHSCGMIEVMIVYTSSGF